MTLTHPLEKQYQSLREARRLLESLAQGKAVLPEQAQGSLKNFPAFDPLGTPLFFASSNYNPLRREALCPKQ